MTVGAWRSLVAHLVRDQGVAGSNPAAPTNHAFSSKGGRDKSAIGAGGGRRFLFVARIVVLFGVVFLSTSSVGAVGEHTSVGGLGFRLGMGLTAALQRLERHSIGYDRTDTDWGRVEIAISRLPVESYGTPGKAQLNFFRERLYAISTSWADHPRRAYNELLELLRSKHGRPMVFTANRAKWMIGENVAILLEIIDEKMTSLDYIFLPLASVASKARNL